MAKIPGACNHTGKCSQSEMLPSRHALGSLTKGDPLHRTLNNYAKATPDGAGGLGMPGLMAWTQPSGKLNRVS